jgi:hypothetical protein
VRKNPVKVSYLPGYGPKPKPKPRPMFPRTKYPFTALINGVPKTYTEPPSR